MSNDNLTHQTPEPLPEPPDHYLLTAVAFEGGMAVLAVGLGWLSGRPPLQTFHWSLAALTWGTAASLPLLGLAILAARHPVGPLGEMVRLLDATVLPLFRSCGWVDLAVIATLAGLGEEMLFRAVVQGGVASWIGGWQGAVCGLLAAAALFGVAHWLTPLYALLAGLIGLYLGGLWLATGNLLAPITAHAVYDLGLLLYLLRGHRTEQEAAS